MPSDLACPECSCWLALHVCLGWLARLSLSARPPLPLPLSAHLGAAPDARQGHHEPHLIPSCPIMALAATPPAPLFLISAHSPSSAPSSPYSVPSAVVQPQHAGFTGPSARRPTHDVAASRADARRRTSMVICSSELSPHVRSGLPVNLTPMVTMNVGLLSGRGRRKFYSTSSGCENLCIRNFAITACNICPEFLSTSNPRMSQILES